MKEQIIKLIQDSSLLSPEEKEEWEVIVDKANKKQLKKILDILQEEKSITKSYQEELEKKFSQLKIAFQKIQARNRFFQEENSRSKDKEKMADLESELNFL